MRVLGALALILVLVVFAVPVKVVAPQIVDLTPTKGKVGQEGLVHGSGLSSGPVNIRFGQTGSVLVPGIQVVSDKVVKFNVPVTPANERDSANPNLAKVTVSIGSDTRTFQFEYDPPGRLPVIELLNPNIINPNIINAPFIIQTSGADFTNNQGRVPTTNDAWLIGPLEAIQGTVVGADETTLRVEFLIVPQTEGTYKFIVGFSDGAAASADIPVVYA